MIKRQKRFLTMLGTGDAFSSTNSVAYAIFKKFTNPDEIDIPNMSGRESILLMIDCGEKMIDKIKDLIKDESTIYNIELFITHMHGDHVGGLSTLIYELLWGKIIDQDFKLNIHIHQGMQEDFEAYLKSMGTLDVLNTSEMNLGRIAIVIHPDDVEFSVNIGAAYTPITAKFIPTRHKKGMKSYGLLMSTERLYDWENSKFIPKLEETGDVIADQKAQLNNPNIWRVYYSGDSNTIPLPILDKLYKGEIDELYQDMCFIKITDDSVALGMEDDIETALTQDEDSIPYIFPHLNEHRFLEKITKYSMHILNKCKVIPYHYSDKIKTTMNPKYQGATFLCIELEKAKSIIDRMYSGYAEKQYNTLVKEIDDYLQGRDIYNLPVHIEEKIKMLKYNLYKDGNFLIEINNFVLVQPNYFTDLYEDLSVNGSYTWNFVDAQPTVNTFPWYQEARRKVEKLNTYLWDNESKRDKEFLAELKASTGGGFTPRYNPNVYIFFKKKDDVKSILDFEFIGYVNGRQLSLNPEMNIVQIKMALDIIISKWLRYNHTSVPRLINEDLGQFEITNVVNKDTSELAIDSRDLVIYPMNCTNRDIWRHKLKYYRDEKYYIMGKWQLDLFAEEYGTGLKLMIDALGEDRFIVRPVEIANCGVKHVYAIIVPKSCRDEYGDYISIYGKVFDRTIARLIIMTQEEYDKKLSSAFKI